MQRRRGLKGLALGALLPARGHVGSRPWFLWANYVAASPFVAHNTRKNLYRRLGLRISEEAHDIGFGCYFHSSEISIGARTFINDFCYFENVAPVLIGDDVAIGMQTSVLTSTHELRRGNSRSGDWDVRPVTIGDGCWIGARAMILPGVTIGRGTVVAAGAVVSDDCDPHRLYGGIPARIVRRLDD
jgi:maltose O-acetyltransferase